MRELELYLHIPFCVRKCAYCDFLSAPAEEAVRAAYAERLLEEIRQQGASCQAYEVSSVFFGGGTPSILNEAQIAALLKQLQKSFRLRSDAEISMECNPGTLTIKKAKAMAANGINRLSLGLQSAQNSELALLGRIHTWEDFLESFAAARDAGCQNMNVDLMSALPGQTFSSWEKTLHQVVSLQPEHISAYSLIIEEDTPFFEQFQEDEKLREQGKMPHLLPSEETERAMYEFTEAFLREKGYERYEISNYARPGYACRHNLGYWERKEYLGLGLGASSLMENRRFQNTSDLQTYLKQPFVPVDAYELDQKAQMEEFMFLGLRVMRGVSRRDFLTQFGIAMDAIYGNVLHKLKAQGLLAEQGDRVFLTGKGIDISNPVLAEFLL